MKSLRLDFDKISDGGERVTHLYPNDVYYAHLSIYHFALQFCRGKTVLDAGCGAGYGAAYLAEHGAQRVDAFDLEPKAVAFSRQHFSRSNLAYRVMSIENITGYPKQYFDVVFTSNALEHVPDVNPFFYSAWELLKPDGAVIIAVPPVTNDLQRQANLDNPYHLNIWTPLQWFHVLNLFFSEVQPYLHGFEKAGYELDFGNTPEETVVNEADFLFEPISIEEFTQRKTLTVIFVARRPKPEGEIPAWDSRPGWVDDSFTRPFDPLQPPALTGSRSPVRPGHLIKRAWLVLRRDGLAALLLRTISYLKRRRR